MNDRRRGLGRGLGALIPNTPEVSDTEQDSSRRPVDVFFPGRPAETNPSRPRSYEALLGRSVDLRDARKPTAPPDPAAGAATPPEDVTIGADPALSASGSAAGMPSVEEGEPAGEDPAAAADLVAVPGAQFREITIDDIQPNPRQPRTVFDEDDLAELTHSVREIGILQPVVVRPAGGGEGGPAYELIMGERRWRAAREAGLGTIPAIVRDTSDDDLLRDALIENLHRAQLNPLEEAAAYDQLLQDFSCTHDELAARLGRSRPQISNMIRLLKLPPLVQRRVAAGVLSAGHARALLGLTDPAAMERLAQRIVSEGLSVRATEEIVALGADLGRSEVRRRRTVPVDERLVHLADRLSDRFDTRVKIVSGARKGRLTVEFAGVEDLERILEVLAPDVALKAEPEDTDAAR